MPVRNSRTALYNEMIEEDRCVRYIHYLGPKTNLGVVTRNGMQLEESPQTFTIDSLATDGSRQRYYRIQ